MAAKRTLREIRNQAALSAMALKITKADPDPVNLQLRLLAAVLQAEDYKKLPQWRQSFLQGLCTGLALGRGVTAGVDVPLPAPEARPPNGYVPEASAEEEEHDAPLAPTGPALAPEQIMALQELLARLRPDAPVRRDAPPAPPRRPGARPRTAIKVDGHSGAPPSASQ